MQRDERLLEFATEKQAEKLQLIWKHGSMRGAAKKEGVTYAGLHQAKKAVLKKAAQRGYAPDFDLVHPVAQGQRLRGTSTLYDPKTGEIKAQWVKSTADPIDPDELRDTIISALRDEIEPAAPQQAPAYVESDLMTLLPIGDHHFGMHAWGEEAGEDYDLKIAERRLWGANEYLQNCLPSSSKCVIASIGDYLHTDGNLPVTPTSKHVLDADSRFRKIMRVAIRATRNMIDLALQHHAEVHLILAVGNHDENSMPWLQEAFAMLYENEPRVTVDCSPKLVHMVEFGKNMLVFHHGHKTKLADLPLLAATDWPASWGRTTFRQGWTGHVHHKQQVQVGKDYNGMSVESLRILAPADAHAAISGYRSISDMQGLVYHKELGEVARHRYNPAMLQD